MHPFIHIHVTLTSFKYGLESHLKWWGYIMSISCIGISVDSNYSWNMIFWYARKIILPCFWGPNRAIFPDGAICPDGAIFPLGQYVQMKQYVPWGNISRGAICPMGQYFQFGQEVPWQYCQDGNIYHLGHLSIGYEKGLLRDRFSHQDLKHLTKNFLAEKSISGILLKYVSQSQLNNYLRNFFCILNLVTTMMDVVSFICYHQVWTGWSFAL